MAGDTSRGLKLLLEPGDYACTINLPDDDGSTREVAGEIELVGGNRPPRGNLFGYLPHEVLTGVATFPQRSSYPVLRGRLRNNQELVLLDVSVTTLFPEQSSFSARAALVGFPQSDFADSFHKIRLQTIHLDRVIDYAPLAETKLPKPKPGEALEWWARERTSRYHEWVGESGAKLSVGFDARARTADPYELYVRYAPVGEIHLPSGLPFASIVSNWLEPLTGLMTVIAGEAASLTYVELTPSSGHEQERRLQLFGSGITQMSYASKPWNGRDVKPAVRIGPESEDLLVLVESWRTHAANRSPLFETYTSLAGVSGDHPRHRFLLLLQAIEGHYGHVHVDKIAEDRVRFAEARTRHLALIDETSLPSDTKRFVKKHLRSRLDPQLRDALTWAIGLVPEIAESNLASASLVAEMQGRDGFDGTWPDALRLLRNDLSHGTRGCDPFALRELVTILELVVRAHVLLALGVNPGGLRAMFAVLND